MCDIDTKYLSKKSELLSLEYKYLRDGNFFIAGVDEVGRGPLAGPVVAAAVIFKTYEKVPAVFDSKALSESKREFFNKELINDDNVIYAISEVSPQVIDQINILQATHLAMKQAVEKLLIKPNFVLIDGNPVKSMPYPNQSVVKGDSKSASIAAASIIAKVYRDNLMKKYALEYPEYRFEEHKGYGTKLHLELIKKYGASPIHRLSFSPLKELYNSNKQLELFT